MSGINNGQILEPECGTDIEFYPPQSSNERRSLEEDLICQESRVSLFRTVIYYNNLNFFQNSFFN